MPLLRRPDGALQIGTDPRRAVMVRPPDGLSVAGLASVLGALPLAVADVRRLAVRAGLRDVAGLDALLAGLVTAGVVRTLGRTSGGRALCIRVHGRGPLSDLLADALGCSAARVTRSSHRNAAGAAGVDLVVLADALAVDPRLARDLQIARVPHLPVRVRDGAGVVGPLVIPGVSSCLSCADLHRTDRDPAWPALAAQLREITGAADRPTVLATAALALGQVQQIIAAVHGTGRASGPPVTLNATLEVDVGSPGIVARRWGRHPLCGCWESVSDTSWDRSLTAAADQA